MEFQDEAPASERKAPSQAQTETISGWAAAGLGVMSFAGWAGALALDARVYAHNALGSFLVHVPLMLPPAALVLCVGVPRLPARERSLRRVAGAVALAMLLTAPALAPLLTDGLFFLPFRLPMMGLGLALAFVDPALRRGRVPGSPARFPPAFVAGLAFGVCAVAAVVVALALPPPQSSCHGLGCGAFVGLAEMAYCGAGILIAVLAVVGASVGYIIGEVVWQRGR
ncbi:MAG TPA: hypothetical protein VJN88_10175 [Ktedonobacterales bacterium]|nr:hypothetical protein [Ktedonobacterales bacterium]